MAGLFQGEWGKSLFYHEDVGKLIRERLPISLHLNLISFILVSAVGWLLAERETLP
ncbi:MAG: hypothetical protein HY667_01910 [Chloroflexi bacterium]|nr:hypothetical protein [Chloroflexota bacterium]